jgi:hypothetical protein
MDSIDQYRKIIQDVLSRYIDIEYAHGDFHNLPVFDCEHDHYLIMSQGWDSGHHTKGKRVHGCLLHVDLIDGKVWIQRDGTEDGIAKELLEAGIPRDRIVLGFHPPEVRPFTDYAAA